MYDRMPYAGFSDLEMLLVEKALRLVWAESTKRFQCHRIEFGNADEDDISSALVMVFDNIWSNDRHLLSELAKYFDPVPAFNSQVGALDYLGQKLKYKPDITFRRNYTESGMSVLNSCLFVEAKLVDRTKTMGNYCGDGLMRFVEGKYAWAVPQAMMLGYVRSSDQHLPDTLAQHFNRHEKTAEYKLAEGPVAFALSRYSDRSYRTVHNRALRYPETNRPLGPITVVHLWLRV